MSSRKNGLPRILAIAGALCLTVTAPVLAQATAHVHSATPGDRAFVTNMLQESRGQLALAKLAERRATNAEVSSAAAQTVLEWTALRARLVALAYAHGAPVRGTLDASQRRALRGLGKTPAVRFGVAYLRDAQRGNQAALDQLRQENDTSDTRTQRFLAYARPIISADEEMTSDDLLGFRST